LPVVRRVAKTEVSGNLAGQATALEVLDGLRGTAQLLLVEVGGTRHGIGQRQRPGLLLCPLGGWQAIALLRHGQADRLGQLTHRVGVGLPRVLHQEPDGGSMRAAAEAVIELLGRRYGKGRGLLVMERAQAHEVGAALLQLHVLAHHIDNVDAVEQVLNKGLRNHPTDRPDGTDCRAKRRRPFRSFLEYVTGASPGGYRIIVVQMQRATGLLTSTRNFHQRADNITHYIC
jgi:hypothetical protein